MQEITNKPLFDLGRLVTTGGALAALERAGQIGDKFCDTRWTRAWGYSLLRKQLFGGHNGQKVGAEHYAAG